LFVACDLDNLSQRLQVSILLQSGFHVRCSSGNQTLAGPSDMQRYLPGCCALPYPLNDESWTKFAAEKASDPQLSDLVPTELEAFALKPEYLEVLYPSLAAERTRQEALKDATESLRFFEELFRSTLIWESPKRNQPVPSETERALLITSSKSNSFWSRFAETVLANANIVTQATNSKNNNVVSYSVKLICGNLDWVLALPYPLNSKSFAALPVEQWNKMAMNSIENKVFKQAVMKFVHPQSHNIFVDAKESLCFFESLFLPGTFNWTASRHISIQAWESSNSVYDLDRAVCEVAKGTTDKFVERLGCSVLDGSRIFIIDPSTGKETMSLTLSSFLEQLPGWCSKIPYPLNSASWTEFAKTVQGGVAFDAHENRLVCLNRLAELFPKAKDEMEWARECTDFAIKLAAKPDKALIDLLAKYSQHRAESQQTK
jgi:hypothetical protein